MKIMDNSLRGIFTTSYFIRYNWSNKSLNGSYGSLCKVTNYEKRWLCKPVSETVSWHCTTRELCIIKTFLGLAIMCLEPDREGTSGMVPGSARVLELSLLDPPRRIYVWLSIIMTTSKMPMRPAG